MRHEQSDVYDFESKPFWLSKVDRAEIVSFDIFDTLLHRKISPACKVFEIVGARAAMAGLLSSDEAAAFPALRMATQAAISENGAREVTLGEIYGGMGCSDESVRDALLELEVEVESDLLEPNASAKALYDRCVSTDKRICAVSDMYLPSSALLGILHNKGFVEIERVFVSCEHACSKRDGKLFDVVLEELGVTPDKTLHIGDSLCGDYLRPSLRGMKAICTKAPQELIFGKCRVGRKSHADTLRPMLDSCASNGNDAHSFGYRAFGPMLWSFCTWLHDKALACGSHDIYFLSRDGYVMKCAYDILFDDIRSHYLVVSRRSLTVPLLFDAMSLDDIHAIIPGTRYFTLAEFSERVGLGDDPCLAQLSDEGFDLEKVWTSEDFYASRVAREYFERFGRAIRKNASRERDGLEAYLMQEGFDGSDPIVDIGWRGTMQAALERCCGCLVRGLYLGIDDSKVQGPADGFLYTLGSDGDALRNETDIAGFFGLLESLFYAPHGSARRYLVDGNGEITPQLSGREIDDSHLFAIEEIQGGALHFVRDVASNPSLSCMRITKDDAFSAIRRLGLSPKNDELRLFGPLPFYDSYYTSLIDARSLGHYLVHPTSFIRDYFRSVWKVGFMKSVVHLPLPYGWIYRTLRGAFVTGCRRSP